MSRMRKHPPCRMLPAIRVLVGVLVVAVVLSAVNVRAESDAAAADKPGRLNVLMITFDDMNWDSLGCTGCPIPGISPNIDRLASEGMRFLHGHVTIAVCQPTRSVWMTGRFPHRNGALGFQPIDTTVPTLQESLARAGYLNGILAKTTHLAPERKFRWDVVVRANQLGIGRSPQLYYRHAKEFFARAKQEGRPFFLMANSQDPHRPFAGSRQEAQRRGGKKPTKKNPKAKPAGAQFPPAVRTIKPSEAIIPDFLPDIPDVRKELAEYFTSVHRADAIAGAVLEALDETGFRENTLVMFLSDHGMPLPFAKTNCWLNSTRTPWIVRWPGKVKPGVVDREHFVAGIDFMPTILDALGLPAVEGVDGRSFLPVLLGGKQDGRDEVFTVFHRTAGKRDYPMRSVQTKRYGYIYNAWSDGKTVFRNESQSGLSFKAMQQAAKTDPKIAARVKLFEYRVPEELYDYETDPAALRNLIDDPAHAEMVSAFRAKLRQQMQQAKDPLLETFQRAVK